MPEVLVVVRVGSGVMNMTEKNGQPSMEEILASIRRIIADEPAGHQSNSELRGTPIMLKSDSVLDESSDFDLPAIFRSSPPPAAAERSAPLLGRLTDAIRGATAAQPEARPISGKDAEAERAGVPDAIPLSSDASHLNGGLSSLRSARSGDTTGAVAPLSASVRAGSLGGPVQRETQQPAGSRAAAMGSGEEPKRVMAAFKDTHFLSMMGPQAPLVIAPPEPEPVAPVVVPAPQPEALVSDFGAIVPGQLDRTLLQTAIQGAQPPLAAGDAGAVPHVRGANVVGMPPPPPLPAGGNGRADAGGDQEATGSIEDATADLLRPMLRQWLADNMPRMVEKALHIEIAESVKAPRKT